MGPANLGQLMAAGTTLGRALFSDEPAVALSPAGASPVPVLLIEPAEPLMAGARWLAAAEELGRVVVLHGAWLGVRAPRGVRDNQYGAAQRAAEVRAARAQGHVAAAMVPYVR
jgi:hypothetical protein